MANLSPFQRGYGSLQIFSVCQQVPNDPASDYLLTGLCQDEQTAQAPGVFRESQIEGANSGTGIDDSLLGGKRLPGKIDLAKLYELDNRVDSTSRFHSNVITATMPDLVRVSWKNSCTSWLTSPYNLHL